MVVNRPKLHGHLFLHLRVYMYQAWNALHTLIFFSGDSIVIGITNTENLESIRT